MNARVDSLVNSKRKVRFSMHGGGIVADMSPCHLQNFRNGYSPYMVDRQASQTAQAALRKSAQNYSTWNQFGKNVPVPRPAAPTKPSSSDPNSNSPPTVTSQSNLNDGNEKPATFVCEGMEVNFDSSDSEDEVKPLTVLKLLKKTNNVSAASGGKGVHIPVISSPSADKDIANRRRKLPQRLPNGAPRSHQIGEREGARMQMSGPPFRPVFVARTLPSWVVLSSSRSSSDGNATSAVEARNCSLTKRPSPPIPPSMRASDRSHHYHQRCDFPPFFENPAAPLTDNNRVGLSEREMRIIDDVIDMMEDVERRRRYAYIV